MDGDRYRTSLPGSPRGRAAAVAVVLALALAGTSGLPAQERHRGVVGGVVTDAETNAPLDRVNVFLAGTTLGAGTDGRGAFLLTGVPDGTYDLVASRVGYGHATERVVVGAGDTVRRAIRLVPRVMLLPEVEVQAEKPEDWRDHLRLFTKEFIGRGEFASACTILNPEVLNFTLERETSLLVATTDSVLRLENLALGYWIDVVLISFSFATQGEVGRFVIRPRFRPMVPRDGEQDAEWARNRRAAYRGSARHFLRALLEGTLEADRFAMFFQRRPVLPEEILMPDDPGVTQRRISFSGWMRVEYRQVFPPRVSYLKVNSITAYVDRRGNIVNPLSVDLAGAWSRSRMSDMIPLDVTIPD